jgi:hypothetical protein
MWGNCASCDLSPKGHCRAKNNANHATGDGSFGTSALVTVVAILGKMRRRKIKDEQFHFLQNRLMKQAEALYEDWPTRLHRRGAVRR